MSIQRERKKEREREWMVSVHAIIVLISIPIPPPILKHFLEPGWATLFYGIEKGWYLKLRFKVNIELYYSGVIPDSCHC